MHAIARNGRRRVSPARNRHVRHSDVIAAVGLTHGGFYRHFESKEQLVAEATAVAIDTLLDTLASAASGNSSCLGLLGSPHETESIPLTEYCRVFLGQC